MFQTNDITCSCSVEVQSMGSDSVGSDKGMTSERLLTRDFLASGFSIGYRSGRMLRGAGPAPESGLRVP